MDELKEKLDGGYRDESKAVAEEQGGVPEEPGRVSEDPVRGVEEPGRDVEEPGRVVVEPGWADDSEPRRADGDAAEDGAEVCS